MKRQDEKNWTSRETIRGVVVPAQWDKEYRVTGLLIACPDEREVRVGNLESFPMLKNLERREVKLTGAVRKEGAVETIDIDRVQPLYE